MKKKVLVVTSTYRSKGANNFPGFVNELCERLAENFNVEVLTQHRPGLSRQEKINAIPVRRFRYAPDRFEVLSESGGINNTLKQKPWTILLIPLFIIGQLISLWKALNRFKPDIIHAHWIVPQGLTAVIARKLGRTNPAIVLTSHGGDLYGLQGKISRYLKRFVLNNCDRICVVSNPMREIVINEYGISGSKVDVCPMGVFLDSTFTPNNQISRTPFSLLFAGRLVEKKGVRYLIETLPGVLEHYPKTSLTIAGDGPEKQNLVKKVSELGLSDNVSFLGAVPHGELANCYRKTAVAVFPFVRADNGDMEGLGLVVVEAMGCGAPVIVGDVPAVHDIVLHNSTGIICDPGDTKQLTGQITGLIESSSTRECLAKAGREYVTRRYSWTICAARYDSLFNNILN